MDAGLDDDEIDGRIIYVPRIPGPLIGSATARKPRDEIDDVLDDLLGADDPTGPTATDAILVVTGLATIITARLADFSDAMSLVGVGLVGLGLVLPLRAVRRRFGDRRRRARSSSKIGDAIPLRVEAAAVARLVALHEQVVGRSESLVPDLRDRVNGVAHDLLVEVAVLLAGTSPVNRVEDDYVAARLAALADLATTLDDPRSGDGDAIRRLARSQAHVEIERLAGPSAIDDAAELRNDLLPGGDD